MNYSIKGLRQLISPLKENSMRDPHLLWNTQVYFRWLNDKNGLFKNFVKIK